MRYSLADLLAGLVNLMLAVVGVILGLRFLLRLFAANPDSGFVNWIYETSREIMGPFRNVFPTANIEGFQIEFSTLFALVVYGLIGMLAFYVINLLTPTETVVRTKRR